MFPQPSLQFPVLVIREQLQHPMGEDRCFTKDQCHLLGDYAIDVAPSSCGDFNKPLLATASSKSLPSIKERRIQSRSSDAQIVFLLDLGSCILANFSSQFRVIE